MKSEICLLNDSFPPAIDGVANTVTNYARVLTASERFSACVVTPDFPGADDSGYPYPVIRYPSVDMRKALGYTAGNPFSRKVQRELSGRDIKLLHTHCPAISTVLAREMRGEINAPIVMTYHTKFDIDIANLTKLEPVQEGLIHALVENVSAVDELWVVSDGAGKNIQSLGYEGDYIIMPNGVDLPRGRAAQADIDRATAGVDLPNGVPVFLFVGRMMWYKGVRIILDALAALKSRGFVFRMVFVGGGMELEEIRAYCTSLKLDDCVIFLGPIHDRSALTAWYSRADLLLFPSSFDTNGLVVREAAACSLGTVLLRGSCAAEGVTDNCDGLLIEENAASLAVCLAVMLEHPDAMVKIGEAASKNLYISWDDSIAKAMERYEIVLDNWRCGKYPRHKDPIDAAFRLHGEAIDTLHNLRLKRAQLESYLFSGFDDE